MVRGWLARGVDGFRLDVFNAFLKDPDLRDNPVIEGGNSPWGRLEHRYDIDQPDFPDADRPVPGDPRRGAGPDVGRRAVLAAGPKRGRASTPQDRHLVFDWSLMESPWTAAAFGAGDRSPRGGVRAGPLADGRALEPRSRAPGDPPLGVGRPRSGAGPRRDRQGRRGRHPGPARDAVPVLRRGDRDGRRRHPARRDRRSAGAPGRARLPVVRPLALPDADAVDGRARAPGSRPAGRGSGSRPDADDAERRAPRRADPDSVLAAYRRLLAFRRTAPRRSGPGRWSASTNRDPDVLAWTRTGGGQQLLVVVSFVGRGAPDRRPRRARRVAAGSPRVGTHRAPAAPDGDGRLALRRPDEAVILEAADA